MNYSGLRTAIVEFSKHLPRVAALTAVFEAEDHSTIAWELWNRARAADFAVPGGSRALLQMWNGAHFSADQARRAYEAGDYVHVAELAEHARNFTKMMSETVELGERKATALIARLAGVA